MTQRKEQETQELAKISILLLPWGGFIQSGRVGTLAAKQTKKAKEKFKSSQEKEQDWQKVFDNHFWVSHA